MAGLISTGIAGFIASARFTGKQIANKAGKLVPEVIEDFMSGFAGHGWKIWKTVAGFFRLEIDELVVRRTMTVFELLIQKIRAIVGAYAITQGNGKIKSVELSEDGTTYLLTLEEDEISVVEHDFVRCQEFSGGQKFYHVEVASVSEGIIRIPASEFDGSSLPMPGDEIVQFGNSSHDEQYAGRHSAIYMHSDESGQPAIDVMFDIYSKDWTGCVKTRVGGDIPGSGGLKGFYCENGMIKGVDSAGHTVYCIYPDGSAMFGDGSAMFNTDKSGYIAGGAIAWEWNAEKKKYVCTMKDVVLTWDNLDDEAKENLKGEPGRDGVPGNPGVDGKVLFTWIRYADTSAGGGISNNPTGKLYIGFAYNKEIAAESNTPSDYTWSLIKGTDGIPGVPGKDGKTTYTWIAYSDNENGEGMYQVPNDNTKYIGIAVNKETSVEGTNPADYTWSLFRGTDGRDGINGANGVNGDDGVSLVYQGAFSSHPANPQNGWYYRNTTDKKSYVYHGAWYVMTVDGSDGANGKNGIDGINGKNGNDGLSVVWKGESATPPSSPQKNWCYRDTDNGLVYIYNGSAWALMVADGNDGANGANGSDGFSVFITYNDSESQPSTPTGNGTAGGWHTAPNANCVWMSQKVASNATSGSWGTPIRIKGTTGAPGADGKPGTDANLLPWIEKWNGYATELGEEYIVTPKMFSGTKSADGKLTGIAQGKDCITIDGKKQTGIFALVDNEVVFALDPVTKKYLFKGHVEADSGVIGGFKIDGYGLGNDGNRDSYITIDVVNGSEQRIAALGNRIPASAGIDSAAYFIAKGSGENRALVVNSSGSTMNYGIFGGKANLAMDIHGGVNWKPASDDHWCMPGFLWGAEINGTSLEITTSWGNGISPYKIDRNSDQSLTIIHNIGHRHYYALVTPYAQLIDGTWHSVTSMYLSKNDNNVTFYFRAEGNNVITPMYFTVAFFGRPATNV